MGVIVPIRGLLLIALAIAATGCANEHISTPSYLGVGVQGVAWNAEATAAIEEADLKRAAKQTMSAKMLAAIALQRVTGRTPDPSRFNELR